MKETGASTLRRKLGITICGSNTVDSFLWTFNYNGGIQPSRRSSFILCYYIGRGRFLGRVAVLVAKLLQRLFKIKRMRGTSAAKSRKGESATLSKICDRAIHLQSLCSFRPRKDRLFRWECLSRYRQLHNSRKGLWSVNQSTKAIDEYNKYLNYFSDAYISS